MNELDGVVRMLKVTVSPTIAQLAWAAAVLGRYPQPRPYELVLARCRVAVLLEARTRVTTQVRAAG